MKQVWQRSPGKLLPALILAILTFNCLHPAFSEPEQPHIKIGVVARRCIEQSSRDWQLLGACLNQHVSGYAFTVIPVKFKKEAIPMVSKPFSMDQLERGLACLL